MYMYLYVLSIVCVVCECVGVVVCRIHVCRCGSVSYACVSLCILYLHTARVNANVSNIHTCIIVRAEAFVRMHNRAFTCPCMHNHVATHIHSCICITQRQFTYLLLQ